MSARTTKMKGQANKVKGKVKKAVGRASGIDRMQASGRADVSEGKGQVVVGEAGQKVKKFKEKIFGKR